MSKVLVISDIHVNDYPRFNYTKGFRLNQFTLLANRLVEIAVEHDCKTLFIAGDIIDKAVSRAKVVSKVNEFLTILDNHFDSVYYILGQHDLDSKDNNHTTEDSVINSIVPPKFIYADKKIIDYEGRKIAFMDWRAHQDLTWIDSKVDLFVGHVTVSDLFGQEIDTEKFKLGIVGDIHQHGKVGNLMKIGVPMQHSMNDQTKGTCIVYDPKTNKGTYVETDPDNSRFLQIFYTKDKDKEGWSNGHLTYHIYRPVVTKGNQVLSDSNPSVEIEQLIQNEVEENSLVDIHNELSSSISQVDTINFNFELQKIEIENFRSIKKFSYDFGSNTIITGNNGSGKSSFILAIYKALVGDRSLAHSMTFGEKKMMLRITLKYEGRKYEITRGSTWGLRIDDAEEMEPYNNKSQFEADIPVRLPFIRYIDSFYFNYWATEILGNMNNARRVELITKYNRLDILDSYHAQSIEKITETQQTIKQLTQDILVHKTKEDEAKSKLKFLRDRVTEHRRSLTCDPKKSARLLSKHKEYIERKMSYDNLLSEVSRIRLLMVPVDLTLRDKLDSEIESLEETISNDSSTISTLKEVAGKVSKLRDDYKSKSIKLKINTDELDKLKDSPKCITCGAPLSEEVKNSEISRLTKLISESKEDLSRIRAEGVELQKPYDGNVDTYLQEYLSKSVSNKTILTRSKAQLKEINDSIIKNEEHTSKIAELEDRLKSLGEPPEEDLKLTQDEESIHNKNIQTLGIIEENLRFIKTTVDSLEHSEVSKLEEEVESKKELLNRYIKYRDLMSKNGSIYRKFLTKLSERLSNDRFQFNVVSERASGAEYFDVNIKCKVDKEFVHYSNLSSGYKTLADLYFISRIINSGGLLVFDEYLRFLDSHNHDDAIQLISETDVNQVIISTHNPNVHIDNSTKIEFYLENGETKANIFV